MAQPQNPEGWQQALQEVGQGRGLGKSRQMAPECHLLPSLRADAGGAGVGPTPWEKAAMSSPLAGGAVGEGLVRFCGPAVELS